MVLKVVIIDLRINLIINAPIIGNILWSLESRADSLDLLVAILSTLPMILAVSFLLTGFFLYKLIAHFTLIA